MLCLSQQGLSKTTNIFCCIHPIPTPCICLEMVVGFEIKRACRTYLSSDAHKAQLGLVTFLTARAGALG